MGTSYVRQSSFADGDTITAALFNDEFNRLLTAFSYASSSTTGHSHDGTAGEGGHIHTIGDQDFLNKIVADSTNNRWGFFVEVSSAAVEQIRIQDGAIVPVTDNDIDLGTSSLEFKDAYFDGTVTTDALVADTADINGGSVDGATLGTNSAITQAVIDNVNINGATIGHTDDTDLITLADGVVTVAGELDATTLDISGNADIDGTLEADAITVDGTALNEYIADTVGAMVSSNTETNITVSYEDGDNTLDFVIGTLNQDTTGTAAIATSITASANNSTDETVYPTFVDGATGTQGIETDTGLTYNPSSGDLTIGGELVAATLDISGNVDVDGTLEADAITVNGTTLAETISDTIGAMVTSNTESGITVAYDDSDNTLDFTVGTLNQDTTGTAATVTGAAQSNITSLGTLTTLTVDNVIVNGTTIGHTSDTDLITLTSGVVTVAGELDATSLDISGDADIDGTLETDALSINGTTVTSTAAELNILDGVTSTAAELNILDGVTSTAAELNILDGVTSTAAELNILDGVTSTAAELNILDGVTSTATEINLLDAVSRGSLIYGNSSGASALLTKGGANTILTSDGTDISWAAPAASGVTYVTKTANYTASDLEGVLANTSGGAFTVTLPASPSAGAQVIVADSGDAFGTNNLTIGRNSSTIDGTAADFVLDITGVSVQFVYNGSTWRVYAQVGGKGGSAVTTAGTQTLTNKTLTSPKINEDVAVTSTATELNVLDGITAVVGELNALDLGSTAVGTAIASKAVILDANKDYSGLRNFTITGELDAATLDVSGDVDIDGTLEADAITVNGATLAETIADTVGAMVGSNTETGISVTYEDGDNTLDFALAAAQTTVTSLLATDIKIGEDDQTKIDFETADEIHFYAANVEQVYLGDNIFGPQSDSDVDLGTTGVRWKDAYVDSITVTGEVDGASLDISGNADIDGTTNLDAVDIDGAVQIDGTTNFGVDDTGVDVKFFGATAGKYMLWDESQDSLIINGGIQEAATTVTSSSNATTINLDTGTNFLHDLTENTTFTFSNPPAAAGIFTLKIIQDSSARAITWPGTVDWPSATAPTLTSSNNGVDVFVFLTIDGGTIWYGFTAGQAMG